MAEKDWKYFNPVELTFGAGAFSTLSQSTKGCKAVLITTPGFSGRGVVDLAKKILGHSLQFVYDGVSPNPTFANIKEAYNAFISIEYDVIIALGGGSVLDTSKAIAAVKASGSYSWLEDHLKSNALFPDAFFPKPIIAIPTTAGTGSEVTMWATVWDMEEKKKYSLSHPSLYPKRAILDPELTLTLKEKETVYSGLDALSHSIEAIWSKNHNPISDIFALKAISAVYDYLPVLRNDLTNLELRSHLLCASLYAGLSFSNTKTALVHSISYPLTAHFGLPHGLACALSLLPVMEYNGTHHFDRIKIMANSLRADATVSSMKKSIKQLLEKLGVKLHLRDYGISGVSAEKICELAITPERAENNIVNINQHDVMNIIKMMF